MNAGFILIIAMFISTTMMMTKGMQQIHSNFQDVSEVSLPLVSQTNLTSLTLLSADKLFKDFLTTQSFERMGKLEKDFEAMKLSYSEQLASLESASRGHPELQKSVTELKAMKQNYFLEAERAMKNHRAMFSAQEDVFKSTRRFQRLHSELSAGMKEYINNQESISVKIMAKSYFVKLKDAEVTTSDALASGNIDFVKKAVAKNRKAVAHLNYAYRGLTSQMPELKDVFDKSVEQFTRDVGKKGGVLDQHNAYLLAKEALYNNITNLAHQVDETMVQLQAFTDFATNSLNTSLIEAGEVYEQGVARSIGIGGFVIFLAIIIGFHLARSVREPLSRILSTLEAIEGGDMTKQIEVKYNNEFSRVSEHINSLTTNLREILIKLNDASHSLTETASSNQKTSSEARAKLNLQREQTSGVATAIIEMSHSVQEVADNAQSSQEMVHQVRISSESGREIMETNISTIRKLESQLHNSVDAVNNLKDMTRQIGSILDVIQNIAGQTNLLALNAAIEAARAGEQGRGFAVVADEVRVLAQRTTESTTEIESMIIDLQNSSVSASDVIQKCMNEMSLSVEQASSANRAMEDVQQLILEISQMSSHISLAASEQSDTTKDIAKNIEEINFIADSSNQAMGAVAQTSDDLYLLANQQGELVSKFKL